MDLICGCENGRDCYCERPNGLNVSESTETVGYDATKGLTCDDVRFEKWLRTACFQKPTKEAYELAKAAWKASNDH